MSFSKTFSKVTVFTISFFLTAIAHAAATQYETRAEWQAAAGASQNIDFSTKDDGTPLSNPADDVFFPTLTLKGVTFTNVRSYLNEFIYKPDIAPMKINLPAGTNAVAVDLRPLFNEPGIYTIKLSSGEVFTGSAAEVQGEVDFFGVVSTSSFEWIELSLNSDSLTIDDFSFVAVQESVEIQLDILPMIKNNPILLKKNMALPVSIYSTADFDATRIDVETVRFGATGTEAAPVSHKFIDINRDGRKDLVLVFMSKETGITATTTSASITGQTLDGVEIGGSDKVKVVGCKKP